MLKSNSKVLKQKAYELLGHEKYLELQNNISTSVELFFPFLKGVNWLLFRSVSFAGREQCEKFNSCQRDCVIIRDSVNGYCLETLSSKITLLLLL